ncbi:MAG: S41 family peptidase [Patescibacteria group bacterium]|nr:S41 family peptidase [Patescibacteria group bacterium]
MVESLGDPYTMFLPPVQNSSFKESMAGQFQGIGAELDMKNKQIIVVAPLDGSPAEKAGIRAGDAILEVNNQSTSGWTLNQAVEKIRGPKGTPVKLAILQKDSTRPKDVNIVRDVISIKSVYGWVKKVKDVDGIKLTNNLKKEEERKVIYLRLSQFGDNTNQEWLGLVNNIYLEVGKDKDFKGVVVDLRNNPGGYLTDATFIASEFIKDGTVVIQDKGNGDKNHFSVTRKGLLVDTPVVVLINKGSASASEIVAGAIRDHKKGKLIGETSFGKGTIQQAEDLGDGAGLHVTIAKWLTPKEIWVHNQGLTPDVKVSLDEKDPSHDIQLEKAIEELLKS